MSHQSPVCPPPQEKSNCFKGFISPFIVAARWSDIPIITVMITNYCKGNQFLGERLEVLSKGRLPFKKHCKTWQNFPTDGGKKTKKSTLLRVFFLHDFLWVCILHQEFLVRKLMIYNTSHNKTYSYIILICFG